MNHDFSLYFLLRLLPDVRTHAGRYSGGHCVHTYGVLVSPYTVYRDTAPPFLSLAWFPLGLGLLLPPSSISLSASALSLFIYFIIRPSLIFILSPLPSPSRRLADRPARLRYPAFTDFSSAPIPFDRLPSDGLLWFRVDGTSQVLPNHYLLTSTC